MCRRSHRAGSTRTTSFPFFGLKGIFRSRRRSRPRHSIGLRIMAYLHLGEEQLALGKPGEAREQFLHVFPYLQGIIPKGRFFRTPARSTSRACDELLGQGKDRNLKPREPAFTDRIWAQYPSIPEKWAERDGNRISPSLCPPSTAVPLLASCLAALDNQSLEKTSMRLSSLTIVRQTLPNISAGDSRPAFSSHISGRIRAAPAQPAT